MALLDVAARIADEVLFPAAASVDRALSVPVLQLELLASAGLYGVAAPASVGGADLDLPTFGRVVEVLAGGCLATTFVWVQHHGLIRALAGPDAPASMRADWLAPLAAGRCRAGAAAALAVHTGPASALVGSDAERLTREALFLLVFGTRPQIRMSLLDRLSGLG